MALRRKFRQTKLFRALVIFCVLLFFVYASPRFILDPVRTFLMTVAWPIEQMASGAAFGVRDFFGFLGSIGELKKENERLSKERIDLLAENASLALIRGENEALRKEVGLLPRESYELGSGEVVGRGGAAGDGILLIDQGTARGIQKGMPVIVGKGVIIGRVSEVFPYSATVMLLTHPESYLNAMTSSSQALGIAKGEHGLGLLLDMVLQSGTLASGDSVVTSGLDPNVPQGLLIGTLQSPGLSPDRLYQRASIVSPIKLENLRYVFVIKKTLEQ